MISFFRLASDAFRMIDNGRDIPGRLRNELKTLKPLVDRHMPPLDTRDRPPPAQIRRQEFSTRLNNWLIVYDWKAARFVGWSDLGADTAVAARTYASWERRFSYQKGFEVVLIGADSSETIKRTHAHYFGKDPNDFDPLNFFAKVLT